MGDNNIIYTSIQIKLILIGDISVGKKSFISRMNTLQCTKSHKKDLPGILSSKILEYNLNTTSIFIQCYIAKGAVNILDIDDSDSSDEDEEIRHEYKIQFNETKKSIIDMFKAISKNAENDPNSLQETIFIFMYDMSDFSTFERLLIYYDSISRKFGLKGNSKCVVIGNKSDRRIVFKDEEYDKINSFMKVDNFRKYDISTKINFAFKQFFYDLIINSIGEDVLYNKEKFKSILNNKTTMSKSERKGLDFGNNKIPEPGKYNTNIYEFDSMEQRNEILNDKKLRFSKKIFVNKQSPTYSPFGFINEEEVLRKKEFEKLEEKREKQLRRIQSMTLKNAGNEIMGNSSLKKGISLSGTSCSSMGNIHLLERSNKNKKRDEEYFNSFGENKISMLHRPYSFRPKSKNYFDDIENRRYQYQQNLNNNLKEKESKYDEQRKKNIEEINNNILERSMKILSKYENYNKELEKKRAKERYLDIVFGNNAYNLDKMNTKIETINLLKRSEEIKPKMQIDIRGNMLNPKKGISIIGKPKPIILKRDNAKLYYLKDDFEKIVDKTKPHSGTYSPRYHSAFLRKTKTEEPKKFDNSKFIQYEKNRLSSAKRKNLEKYFNELREKKKQHEQKYNLIKKEEDEYHKLLLLDYYSKNPVEDGKYPPPINFSQVEDRAPSYTIAGRHVKKKRRIGNNFFSILNNEEEEEEIPYLPNPDISKVRPNNNGFTFGKEERFKMDNKDIIKENDLENEFDEDDEVLFGSENKKNFSNIQPYDSKSKRKDLFSNSDNPGPGQYNLRGFAEEIVESAYKRYTGKNEKENEKKDIRDKTKNDDKDEKIENTQEIIIDENVNNENLINSNNVNNNRNKNNINNNQNANIDIIHVLNNNDNNYENQETNINNIKEDEKIIEQKPIENNQINNDDFIDLNEPKNTNQKEQNQYYMEEEANIDINKTNKNIESKPLIEEEKIITRNIDPLENETTDNIQKPKTQQETVLSQEQVIEYTDGLEKTEQINNENTNNNNNEGEVITYTNNLENDNNKIEQIKIENNKKENEEEVIGYNDNLEKDDNKIVQIENENTKKENKREIIGYNDNLENDNNKVEQIKIENNKKENEEEVIGYNDNLEKDDNKIEQIENENIKKENEEEVIGYNDNLEKNDNKIEQIENEITKKENEEQVIAFNDNLEKDDNKIDQIQNEITNNNNEGEVKDYNNNLANSENKVEEIQNENTNKNNESEVIGYTDNLQKDDNKVDQIQNENTNNKNEGEVIGYTDELEKDDKKIDEKQNEGEVIGYTENEEIDINI